ncbi:MAG: hypothetical protein PUB35_08810 [Campylobacteraceae bacterium]|nr:hypothetical protein [Campylobacteraceae bacterium]
MPPLRLVSGFSVLSKSPPKIVGLIREKSKPKVALSMISSANLSLNCGMFSS